MKFSNLNSFPIIEALLGNILYGIILFILMMLRKKLKIKIKNILIILFIISVFIVPVFGYHYYMTYRYNISLILFLYFFTAIFFIIKEVSLSKIEKKILQLISSAQDAMQKASDEPRDHYVGIQMIINYFDKSKTEIKYHTDILRRKGLIKAASGYDQFSLTEKGREYLVKNKLINKKF